MAQVKLLIAEDDPVINDMYRSAFAFDGYDVKSASDGQEALDIMADWLPRILLLDIMMPKLNGLDVLAAMKKNPRLKNIPVIILTNLSDRHDAEAALELGAVKFIVKAQHTPKEITDIVKEIVKDYTRHDIHDPSGQTDQ